MAYLGINHSVPTLKGVTCQDCNLFGSLECKQDCLILNYSSLVCAFYMYMRLCVHICIYKVHTIFLHVFAGKFWPFSASPRPLPVSDHVR